MASADDKLPLSRALTIIFFSVLIVSGGATLGWFYWLHLQHERAEDGRFVIRSIEQVCWQGPILDTQYFAELLGLNAEFPVNLYTVNPRTAQKTIAASPHIKWVKVRRVRPDTLQIEYRSREPIAYLLDYHNVVVDQDYVPFPAYPFLTPKRLPNLYLGLQAFGTDGGAKWGQPLPNEKTQLADSILEFFRSELATERTGRFKGRLDFVDTSRVNRSAYGQREIVVAYTDCAETAEPYPADNASYPRTLRLHTSTCHGQLRRYLLLREELLTAWGDEPQPTTIDLRNKKLALYQTPAARRGSTAEAYRSGQSVINRSVSCSPQPPGSILRSI